MIANSILADQAHIALLEKALLENPKFDSTGNIIRDFKKELYIYAQDERNVILPQIKTQYFDSHSKFDTHLKNASPSPVIDTIKTPDIIKVELIQKPAKIPIYRPNITIELVNNTTLMVKENPFVVLLKRLHLF